MVTHDVQEAVLIADRIAVMKAGRVLAYDTPKALMSETREPDVADLIAMPRRWAERIGVIVGEDGEPRQHE